MKDFKDKVAVITDVSKIDDVKSLVKKSIEAFEKVDLLFNNAGVATGDAIWESSINSLSTLS